MNAAHSGRHDRRHGIGARMRKMALPLILGGLAGSVGLGWTLAQDFGAPPPPPLQAAQEPVAGPAKTLVKTNTIKLPIEINEQARAHYQEVHIWVKEAPHGPWLLKDRVQPTQTIYTFHAPRDGEYWFKLGTLDCAGRSNIADINREMPDTIVVVAAKAPMIDPAPVKAPVPMIDLASAKAPMIDLVSLGETPDGTNVQVVLRQGAIDKAQVRFHYQTGNRQWQPLDPQPQRPDLFCIPSQAVLTGMVRVSAIDPMGIPSTREFNLNQLAAANPGGNASSPLVDPRDRINPVAPPKPTLFPKVGEKFSDRVEVVSQKPVNAVVIPNHPHGAPQPLDPIIYSQKQEPLQGVGGNSLPATEKQSIPGKAGLRNDTVPINRHLVGHPRVVLDYQLDQVGASGVGRVDIYLTRDHGQTWHKIGVDADRKSPVEVNLPGDGLYGVSLAVTNGRGFGGGPPQSGDTPDWWVEVDTVKPQVEITQVRTGNPDQDAAVYISWMAKDKNLANEAIDLFYAPTREGPWQPIARGLRNDGQYRWQPPREAGAQAFIRLVANDMVGNTASVETAQPVLLDDMSRPRARPVGLSPAARPTLPPVATGGGD